MAEVPTCLKTLKELTDTDYAKEFDDDDQRREILTFMAQLDRIMAAPANDEHRETRRQAISIVYFGKTIHYRT